MNEDVMVHVVDDDGSICKAIARLLRTAGFQTRTYASAGELLAGPVGKEDANNVALTDLRIAVAALQLSFVSLRPGQPGSKSF
jgi:FixJ family two-component response regulator